MSITFPLAASDFWNVLNIAAQSEFELRQYKRQSMDGAGNLIPSSAGQAKWVADVTLAPYLLDQSGRIEAMIKVLLARSGTFNAYDKRRPFPKADPQGALISGSTVLVRTKGSDNRSLSLKELPGGYVLSIGDRLSVSYGSGKRALLEVMESVTATVGGTTAEFEVSPFLSTGIQVDNGVDLVKPVGRFQIVPGSYQPAKGEGRWSAGIGFSMISVQK